MKTKDLMVGDWVMHGKKKRKCYNICGHTNDVMLDNGVFTNVMNINPMPLTKDILEKNGFEDIGDDTYQLTERPYWFWVDFYNHEYGCEFDTSTYEYEDSEHRLNLKGIPYVHELQHAMRLCGIEKEIIV